MRVPLGVEQDVDGGGIAGRDRDAMVAHVLEEAARREFLRHDQGGAAIKGHQRAQELRRGPVERAEVIDAIIGGDAETAGGWLDVAEILAIVQHHALWMRAGARGEQDHGVVVCSGSGDAVARREMCERAVAGVLLGPVEASEPHPWRGDARKQFIEPEPILMQHQRRLEPGEDIAELIAVHLDMDGANGRPISHHAEIADQVLDRVGGKQRHPVVGAEAATAQKGGDAADRLPQLAIGHGPPALGEHDPGLPWVVSGGPVDPVSQQRRVSLHREPS